MTKMVKTAAAAAEKYTRMGYIVFPISPGGKRPRMKWQADRETDEDKVRDADLKTRLRWFNAADNIAIRGDGLIIVDVDKHNNGSLLSLVGDDLERREDFRRCPLVATPGGGQHYFFRCPEGVQIGISNGKVARGIDIRTAGGYVVAAPSFNAEKNKGYKWLRPLVAVGKLPVAPDWLVEMILAAAGPPKGPSRKAVVTIDDEDETPITGLERERTLRAAAEFLRENGADGHIIFAALRAINKRCQPAVTPDERLKITKWALGAKVRYDRIPDHIPNGQRNNDCFRIACWLRAAGWRTGPILAAMQKINERCCRPPMGDGEVCQVVRSAARYAAVDIVAAETAAEPIAAVEKNGVLFVVRLNRKVTD